MSGEVHCADCGQEVVAVRCRDCTLKYLTEDQLEAAILASLHRRLKTLSKTVEELIRSVNEIANRMLEFKDETRSRLDAIEERLPLEIK